MLGIVKGCVDDDSPGYPRPPSQRVHEKTRREAGILTWTDLLLESWTNSQSHRRLEISLKHISKYNGGQSKHLQDLHFWHRL